jgi:hypothetical protein
MILRSKRLYEMLRRTRALCLSRISMYAKIY